MKRKIPFTLLWSTILHFLYKLQFMDVTKFSCTRDMPPFAKKIYLNLFGPICSWEYFILYILHSNTACTYLFESEILLLKISQTPSKEDPGSRTMFHLSNSFHCKHMQACRPRGCQGCHSTPRFCRSVNPISTRRGKFCPSNYNWHPRIFSPLTALTCIP